MMVINRKGGLLELRALGGEERPLGLLRLADELAPVVGVTRQQPLVGERVGRELVTQEAADDLLREDDGVQGHVRVLSTSRAPPRLAAELRDEPVQDERSRH